MQRGEGWNQLILAGESLKGRYMLLVSVPTKVYIYIWSMHLDKSAQSSKIPSPANVRNIKLSEIAARPDKPQALPKRWNKPQNISGMQKPPRAFSEHCSEASNRNAWGLPIQKQKQKRFVCSSACTQHNHGVTSPKLLVPARQKSGVHKQG